MKKLILVTLLIVAGVFLARDFVIPAWFKVPPIDAKTVRIVIDEGTVFSNTTDIFLEKGIIDSAFWYGVYGRIDKDSGKIKVGEYSFKEGMSYSSIVNLLARGPIRDEVKITIIEGWTIHDIEEKLLELDIETRPSDFLAERFEDEFDFLADLPKGTTLEGYLFPDTYRVWADELPDALFRKQLQLFELKTASIRTDIKSSGRDFYDVLTLASIIEKEARFDSDRPIVAGIFQNRLEIGMLLQSDATLNYVTKSGRSRLTAEDLKNKSPYNTYKYLGLPPSPIGNPGIASLKAAVSPTDTNYLYFLTDEAGKTYYASTLQGHSANRYKAFGE